MVSPFTIVQLTAAELRLSHALTYRERGVGFNEYSVHWLQARLRCCPARFRHYSFCNHVDLRNLKTKLLPRRQDTSFCCNVMACFSETEQKRAIRKFGRCLQPKGFGDSYRLFLTQGEQGAAYRRMGANA